jgi:hypothetical protein
VSNAYTTNNTAWRERLLALLSRVSDADMRRPAGKAGWTVAGLFGHLAFWDQRALVLLDRWKTRGIAASPIDVDVVNDATRPFLNALDPSTIRTMARDAAAAIDAAIEALTPEVLARVESEGKPVRLDRGNHREHHLAQIEAALTR